MYLGSSGERISVFVLFFLVRMILIFTLRMIMILILKPFATPLRMIMILILTVADPGGLGL